MRVAVPGQPLNPDAPDSALAKAEREILETLKEQARDQRKQLRELAIVVAAGKARAEDTCGEEARFVLECKDRRLSMSKTMEELAKAIENHDARPPSRSSAARSSPQPRSHSPGPATGPCWSTTRTTPTTMHSSSPTPGPGASAAGNSPPTGPRRGTHRGHPDKGPASADQTAGRPQLLHGSPQVTRHDSRSRPLISSAVTETSSRLTATAEAYDAVAVRYADFVRGELDHLPLDRAVLAAFAEFVRTANAGPVADLGCGPGRITAHLRDLGLDVFGLDLSRVMIDLARSAYPGLRFEAGSMDALDLADGELGGIVSWYSIIHAAPRELPAHFAEFRRVLAPGGHLLVAFFESGGGPVAAFDHKVAPAFRWPIDDLAALAREAEFAEVGRLLREPRENERYRRGHLLLRRQ